MRLGLNYLVCDLDVSVMFPVMQMAWRERDPQARVKAAHEAMEKNPE